MSSPNLLLAFVAASLVFAAVPGPAMLYAAARTLAGGRSAGLSAALGIHLGGYAHVGVAVAGLSLAFHGAPTLFLAMKLLGAAYLAWLGLALLRARAATPLSEAPDPASGRRAFGQSVAIEVLNPATALFFLAFLPQFVSAGSEVPVWLQLALLGTAVNLILSSGEILVVFLAAFVTQRLRVGGSGTVIAQRLSGSVLLSLALHLAFVQGLPA